KKRFDSSELQCWTDEARKTLKPKLVHELAGELADRYRARPGSGKLNIPQRNEFADPTYMAETFLDEEMPGGCRISKQILRRDNDPHVLALSVVTLLHAGDIKNR